MCSECGWRALVSRILRQLDRGIARPGAFVLEAAAELLTANQHATPEQVDAIEAVLEHRQEHAS